MFIEFPQDNHVIIDFHEIVSIFLLLFVWKVDIDMCVDILGMVSHCCLCKYSPSPKWQNKQWYLSRLVGMCACAQSIWPHKCETPSIPFNTVFDKSHDVKMCLLFISYKIGPFVSIKSVNCALLVYTRQLNNAKRCKFAGTLSSHMSSMSIISEFNLRPDSRRKIDLNSAQSKTNYCQWNVNIGTIYLKVTFWCLTARFCWSSGMRHFVKKQIRRIDYWANFSAVTALEQTSHFLLSINCSLQGILVTF